LSDGGLQSTAVQEALNIPSDQVVILVIPVGYVNNSKQTKTQLSLLDIVHQNGW